MAHLKDWDSFSSDCRKGFCNRHTLTSRVCAREGKQKRCFDRYNRLDAKHKEEAKTAVDDQWVAVQKIVRDRDQSCRFVACLTLEEAHLAKQNDVWAPSVLDCAHVFGRGSYPFLKYDVDNVVLMSRRFHSAMDTYRDPVTGKPMSDDQRDAWWRRIIGNERFDKLETKIRDRND